MSTLEMRLQQIVEYARQSWLVMTWVDILDVAVVAALLSIFLVWLQQKASRSILFAITTMLITFTAARTLRMYMTSTIFQYGFMALCIIMVVIFQEDVRRALEALSAWRPWGKRKKVEAGNLPDLLVDCLYHFSENKTGALIVVQGRQTLEAYIRGGIPVRGKVSLPLLQSIFDPNSPGHDGAVTVVDGLIDQLGAHLPLSRNSHDTGRLGTRHAAALGLAERCDALILVVSEETGTLSIAHNGRMGPAKSESAVREAIRNHFRKAGPEPLHRGFFRIPWLRLMLASALSFAMWLSFVRPMHIVQRTLELPIKYQDIPNGWTSEAPVPARVKVTVQGPEGPVTNLELGELAAWIDLGSLGEGQKQFEIAKARFGFPSQIKIQDIDPKIVTVVAYSTSEFLIPVKVAWAGGLERAPSSEKIKIEPANVTLRLPKNVSPPVSIETEPVNPLDIYKTERLQAKLRMPASLTAYPLSTPTVEVLLLQKKK